MATSDRSDRRLMAEFLNEGQFIVAVVVAAMVAALVVGLMVSR